MEIVRRSHRSIRDSRRLPVAESRDEEQNVSVGAPVCVLHILGSLDRGGAETAILRTSGALPPGTVDTHFLLVGGKEGEMAAEAKSLGAFIHVSRISLRLPWRCW